ncbi:MAG TPA: hemerythrin domain-containing protein [Methylophilaceae bacterium]|nr:hemerythrin domain-containing protein [Methylophilaceae bacterium]
MQTPTLKAVKNKSAITKATPKAPIRASKKDDAIVILTSDHAKVKKLFKEFEKLSKKNDVAGKTKVANEICLELTVHAQAEEEVFYTAARSATHEDALLNEADVEHDSAKELIAQIQTMSPEDPMYDAKVTVLGEYIEHHVEEEETEMFPKVRKTKLDLIELGLRLKTREDEIKSSLTSLNGDVNIPALKKSAQDAALNKH